MKGKFKVLSVIAVALAVVFAFAACSGNKDPIGGNDAYAEYTEVKALDFGEGVSVYVASYSSIARLEKDGKYAIYDVVSDTKSGFDFDSIYVEDYHYYAKAVYATKTDEDGNTLYGLITLKGTEVMPFTKDEIDYLQSVSGADLFAVGTVIYSIKDGVKKQLIDLKGNLAFADPKELHFYDTEYFSVKTKMATTFYNTKGKRLSSTVRDLSGENTIDSPIRQSVEYLGGGNLIIFTRTKLEDDAQDYDYLDDIGFKYKQTIEKFDMNSGKFSTLKIDGIVGGMDTFGGEGVNIKESYRDRVVLYAFKLNKDKTIDLDSFSVLVLDKNGSVDIEYKGYAPRMRLAKNRYFVRNMLSGQFMIIDSKGNVVVEIHSDFDVAPAGSSLLVEGSGGCALFDKNGKQLIEFDKYDEILQNWNGKMVGYTYDDEAEEGKEYTVSKIADNGTATQILQSQYSVDSRGLYFYYYDTAEGEYVLYNFDGTQIGKIKAANGALDADNHNRLMSDEATLRNYALKQIEGTWYRFA